MNNYFSIKKIQVFIKLFIALGLFVYIEDFSKINSFTTLTVAILELIIILELVRMLVEFVLSDNNQIKLRFMIDSTIIFFIRDIMLVANHNFKIQKIASMLGIVLALFIFRVISMKYSPKDIEK